MSTIIPDSNDSSDSNRGLPPSDLPKEGWIRRSAPWLITVGVLALTAGFSYYWMTNRPTANRKPRPQSTALVTVVPVTVTQQTILVEAMGTVVAAREMPLTSRVAGEIVELSESFIPGGQFRARQRIAKVDPRDFELAVQLRTAEVARAAAEVTKASSTILQKQAGVDKAQADLALEKGRREAALGEYKLLGETIREVDKSLILREPQQQQAKAACASARASLESAKATKAASEATHRASQVSLDQAKLDLLRTDIVAPFDAMIQSRKVNLGSNVVKGTVFALLVGTDQYWMDISVPVDELPWLAIPGFTSKTGSTVRIYCDGAWPAGTCRTGVVTRLRGEIESQGRMARLLVTVDDPLDLKKPAGQRRPLILGDYVRVEIVGRKLENVIRVERVALRNGGQVWVMNDKNELEIRDVKVIWSKEDAVFLSSGLGAGDRLIVSDLGTPVPGLRLRAEVPAVKEARRD
jgi:RND family efflux transporter MFP subunit